MALPDIAAVIGGGIGNPWVYLPAALALGALHALEPGHAKGLMAAFIIAVKGTVRQAVVLGVSAAVGHSAVIVVLAILGVALGREGMLAAAEPWLLAVSSVLLLLLALRIVRMTLHGHDHGHSHDHDAGHCHGPAIPHHKVNYRDVIWFGLSAGLMPCPSALAVLLVCWQLKQLALGVVMVGAFSVGLGASLVAVGVAVALGQAHVARKVAQQKDHGHGVSWILQHGLRWAPVASACLVGLLGVGMGVRAAVLLGM